MKTTFPRTMRRTRAIAVAGVTMWAVYVGWQLPAIGGPGDGGGADHNGQQGCGQCHGNAGGQPYVIKGAQLFPTRDIFPNGPTKDAANHHETGGGLPQRPDTSQLGGGTGIGGNSGFE